jgi:pyruvate dehydrogenase E2 component (dihydrolipoamide acetyltransferase)
MTTTTRATPAVRVMAARHGVSLAAVAGTGAGGRITTGDVTRAADDATFRALFGATDGPASSPVSPSALKDALYRLLFSGG